LWAVPPSEAVRLLRGLVEETVGLVERELLEVDTAGARKSLARDDRAWKIE
jgi:hypothetical protein